MAVELITSKRELRIFFLIRQVLRYWFGLSFAFNVPQDLHIGILGMVRDQYIQKVLTQGIPHNLDRYPKKENVVDTTPLSTFTNHIVEDYRLTTLFEHY